ncbi:hypothetical protein [Kingella sp. (in: b-proteobacteria)]|uniref:hypothetical protein n=1 Tax=Kingella sp. (in: b-proteobacteria) TaxID=2020713 RepID=UPI0026DA7472|nr:hypothetical protein [Kingella sp. (in: b-proteobacteria)]MDO4656534.1 hypothetical protein [Kingella sp. (in: b-proteobacteria)]
MPSLLPKVSGCLNAGGMVGQPENCPRAPTACWQAVRLANKNSGVCSWLGNVPFDGKPSLRHKKAA